MFQSTSFHPSHPAQDAMLISGIAQDKAVKQPQFLSEGNTKEREWEGVNYDDCQALRGGGSLRMGEALALTIRYRAHSQIMAWCTYFRAEFKTRKDDQLVKMTNKSVFLKSWKGKILLY